MEVLQEEQREDRCGDGGVERDGVKTGMAGWNADAPGEGGGKAGIAAFGEVTESEECPDESGAGTPGVEGAREWEVADAEIDQRG